MSQPGRFMRWPFQRSRAFAPGIDQVDQAAVAVHGVPRLHAETVDEYGRRTVESELQDGRVHRLTDGGQVAAFTQALVKAFSVEVRFLGEAPEVTARLSEALPRLDAFERQPAEREEAVSPVEGGDAFGGVCGGKGGRGDAGERPAGGAETTARTRG